MKAYALAGIATILFILHQDFWNWGNKTLVFNFIPITLVYHACYSIACAIMMVFFVKYLWPHELEDTSETHGS